MSLYEAIATGEFVDGQICRTCKDFIDEADAFRPDPDWDRTAVLAKLAQFELHQGHVHSGEFSDCAHRDEPCEMDCDCAEDPWSDLACSLCGSRAKGNRYDVILIKEKGKEE